MKYPKATKETPAENSEHDFSEYMWMAEEGVENFDRQVQNTNILNLNLPKFGIIKSD